MSGIVGTSHSKSKVIGRSQDTAKVWANFNGSSFGERDSYNVSSFTDNGTGDYTVTFSSPMSNTNYVAVVTATNSSAGDFQDVDGLVLSTGNIRIYTGYVSATDSTMSVHNVSIVGLVIFGD